MGERAALASVAGFLGESAYRQGRLDEADRHSLASAELGSSDDRSNEALWRSVRMKVLAARGALERAEELAQAAIEIASRNDLLDLQAGIWLDLAEIRRTSGRAGMEAAARQALVLYERKGHVVGAARAKAMLDTAASQP